MTSQTPHNYKLNPDGSIATRNLCAASLPEIAVEITSGRTTYRFLDTMTDSAASPPSCLPTCPLKHL